MSSISTGAWIGIGAGLLLAIVEYVVVIGLVRRNLQPAEPELVDRRLRPIKWAMAFGFIALPVVGYFVGTILAADGVLPP